MQSPKKRYNFSAWIRTKKQLVKSQLLYSITLPFKEFTKLIIKGLFYLISYGFSLKKWKIGLVITVVITALLKKLKKYSKK